MQGVQTPGTQMRIQETGVVEQQRAAQDAEGDDQEHHQANKVV